jgi:DNA-binding CsgD family transcriptional regulator
VIVGRPIASPVLIGRAGELDVLKAAMSRASEIEASVVLVVGEAGIGKTRLIDEFRAWAEANGADVRAGTCLEVGAGGFPYGPIVEALRPVIRGRSLHDLQALTGPAATELGRLFPEVPLAPAGQSSEHSSSLQPDDRSPVKMTGRAAHARLFEVILRLVGGLAAERPQVLVVEDLHWADTSTRELVGFLAHNLRQERVLVIGTFRDELPRRSDPLRPFVAQLLRNPRVEYLEIERLTERDVRDLLRAILGTDPDPRLAREIARRSDGNPFFVEELLHASLGGWDAGQMPRTVRELLLARIASLSTDAVAVLRAVAVAGPRAVDDVIGDVVGLPPRRYEHAVRECVGSMLISPQAQGPYRFRHTLLGEVVAEDLLSSERRNLHAAVAACLMGSAPETWRHQPHLAAELARHWDAAGRLDLALVASIAAGAAANEAYAFGEASAHYERAVRAWPAVDHPEEHAGIDLVTLLEQAARAAFLAGDLGRAVDHAARATDAVSARDDPVRAAGLRRVLASYLSTGGDDERAIAVLEDAVSLLEGTALSPTRAWTVTGLAAELMLQGRFAESRSHCQDALRMARALGLMEVEAQVLNFLGVDLVNLGLVEEGLGQLREAVALADRCGPPVVLLEAINNLAVMLDRADRPAEGVTVAVGGVEQAEQLGLDRITGGVLRATAGAVLRRVGRWDEATAVLTIGLVTQPEGELAISLYKERGLLRVAEGEFESAESDLQTARLSGAHARRADTIPGIAEAEAELALWRGDPDAAAAAVREALSREAETAAPITTLSLCWLGIRAQADRAEVARARRVSLDVGDAIQRGGELLSRAHAFGNGFPGTGAPATSGMLATIALATGEHGRLVGAPAPQAWRDAYDRWDAIGVPYAAAYARYRCSEAILAAHGERSAARDLLGRAAASASRLGARPLHRAIAALAKRSRIDLAAATSSFEPGRPSTTPSAGRPFGLTPRELDVLALVAEGRTNRQIATDLFISEKTVGIHMTNILGKLGVSHRADAAALYERLDIQSEQRTATAVVTRAFLFAVVARPPGLAAALGKDGMDELRQAVGSTVRRVAVDSGGDVLPDVDDVVVASFVDSTLAMEAAIAVQRTLAEQRQVRGFGPHVAVVVHLGKAGSAEPSIGGPALTEASRILSLAEGGEILVSETAIDAGSRGLRARAGHPRPVPIRSAGPALTVFSLDWRRPF